MSERKRYRISEPLPCGVTYDLGERDDGLYQLGLGETNMVVSEVDLHLIIAATGSILNHEEDPV